MIYLFTQLMGSFGTALVFPLAILFIFSLVNKFLKF